jgi:hypothetical protein
MFFVFGNMLDCVVHHSMTKAFISAVTWVDQVVLLQLIQNASWCASSYNLLARAFFIFLLSTPNTLAIAVLLTTDWIDWLAENVQIISLATTTSWSNIVGCDPGLYIANDLVIQFYSRQMKQVIRIHTLNKRMGNKLFYASSLCLYTKSTKFPNSIQSKIARTEYYHLLKLPSIIAKIVLSKCNCTCPLSTLFGLLLSNGLLIPLS